MRLEDTNSQGSLFEKAAAVFKKRGGMHVAAAIADILQPQVIAADKVVKPSAVRTPVSAF